MFLVSKIESRDKTFLFLFALLLLKAVLCMLLLPLVGMGLSPDEAQYWTWSGQLALGYYSKPPLIAWQIFLTTKLFGNTLIGVRIGAILLNLLLSLAIWRLARTCLLSPKVAFWAALTFAFSPLGFFFAFPATTDLGAFLFFTLAISEVVQALNTDRSPNYVLLGTWIFLGALYKWVVFAFWPFLFLFLIFYRNLRHKSLLWGILISLLALLPTAIWNLGHDWATFKHVFSTIFQSHLTSTSTTGNFLDFLGAQIGLIFPTFFILMILGVVFAYRSQKKSLVFLAAFPTALLLYFSLAFFKKIQPNWALFLYPPGFVLLARLQKLKPWLSGGVGLSFAFCLCSVLIPQIQSSNLAPQFPISYKANPFRQTLGWEKIAPALVACGYRADQDFLFADKYQLTSLLSFYGPEKKRAYFFNLGQSRKNQFSYWPQMHAQEIDNTGYFVIAENTQDFAKGYSWYLTHYKQKLAPYFAEVEVARIEPLFEAYGKTVKFAVIFRCRGYNGDAPETFEKY